MFKHLLNNLRPSHKRTRNHVPEAMKQHFITEGWILLRQAVPPLLIDKLLDDIAAFRLRKNDGKDEYGRGKRIGLLHVSLESSLKVALNQDAVNFLRWYFGDEPVLFGSLTFDVGTEQNAHHDAAFFCTSPGDAMAGVWIALEDIHEASGPLFYVPQSHLNERLEAKQVLAHNPILHQQVMEYRASGRPASDAKNLADEVYAAWDVEMQRRLKEQEAEKLPALISKGDIFIWHGWLVHGGLPRLRPELSRHSMVCHYIGLHSKMWNQYDFFLNGDRLDQVPPISFQYQKCNLGIYIKHENPVVFSDGNRFFKA